MMLRVKETVVPLVGTWIEILASFFISSSISVVPLVGTWIEILICEKCNVNEECRSPRGNVD